ncbi:MAG: glutathione peroxidase [Xanthobacteraceae bacterium]
MTTVFDFSARALDGREVALRQFEGQALLIVNTASACGFTPQYKGLEELHRTYAPRGFAVLGFPCNQFGRQEPSGAAEIAAFCAHEYGVTFPMFDKIEVNGAAAHPLYKFLKNEKAGLLGSSIKWNFTKFLCDRSGRVVARHPPTTRPESLASDIEALL